mmetsp:Transcript_3429/g.8935  ORF Transcript_3429/g.8935 Transcript_3429/m.8935 type:complete len:137 (+) Transcript_3429:1071-1481(+)
MNSGDDTQKMNANFHHLPGASCPEGSEDLCTCHVRHVWAHQDLGQFVGSFGMYVDRHDAAFLIVSDCKFGRNKGDTNGPTWLSRFCRNFKMTLNIAVIGLALCAAFAPLLLSHTLRDNLAMRRICCRQRHALERMV